jgi:predicted transcriptional regulator
MKRTQDRATFDERVGRTLRAMRKAAGLRQVEIAARAGWAQSYVSKMERGASLTFYNVGLYLRALEPDPTARARCLSALMEA